MNKNVPRPDAKSPANKAMPPRRVDIQPKPLVRPSPPKPYVPAGTRSSGKSGAIQQTPARQNIQPKPPVYAPSPGPAAPRPGNRVVAPANQGLQRKAAISSPPPAAKMPQPATPRIQPPPRAYRPNNNHAPGHAIQPLMHSLAFKYDGQKRKTIEKGDEGLRKENPLAYRDAPISELEKDEDLYLHAHGSSKRFGRLAPDKMAEYLVEQGLPKHARRIYLLGCNTAGYAPALQKILNDKPYSYKVLVQGTPGTQWVGKKGVARYAESEESAEAYRVSRDPKHLKILITPALRVTPAEEMLRPAAIWQPDSAVTKCPLCDGEFGMLKRKHHCRNCGKVVCDACSKGTRDLSKPAVRPGSDAETGAVRVCDLCKF